MTLSALLGNAHLTAQRAMEAVESYTKAIELDPENAVYYSNRAAAFTLQEDWSSAIEDGMAAISLNPRYAKAYGRLGAAYLGVGNAERAAEAYAKALELEPENEQYKRALEQSRRGSKSAPSQPANPSAQAPPPFQMPGGLGGLDLGSMMRNPEVMNMVNRVMQDPSALSRMMSDPNVASMMQGLGMGGFPGGSRPSSRSPPAAEEEEDEKWVICLIRLFTLN